MASRSQPSIVERLRDHEISRNHGGCGDCYGLVMDDAADEIESLKARVAELEGALQFIADGYENHNVSHVDYRVKVYQVALDALSHAGPVARDGER